MPVDLMAVLFVPLIAGLLGTAAVVIHDRLRRRAHHG
jgi:hypothetical protein